MWYYETHETVKRVNYRNTHRRNEKRTTTKRETAKHVKLRNIRKLSKPVKL